MAKTYRHRKNVWEDGSRSSKKKGLQKPSSKKKYRTNEVLEYEELNYERLR